MTRYAALYPGRPQDAMLGEAVAAARDAGGELPLTVVALPRPVADALTRGDTVRVALVVAHGDQSAAEWCSLRNGSATVTPPVEDGHFAYGVTLWPLGEECDQFMAAGEVEPRRMVAAANHYARTVERLKNLRDDDVWPSSDLCATVRTRTAHCSTSGPDWESWGMHFNGRCPVGDTRGAQYTLMDRA